MRGNRARTTAETHLGVKATSSLLGNAPVGEAATYRRRIRDRRPRIRVSHDHGATVENPSRVSRIDTVGTKPLNGGETLPPNLDVLGNSVASGTARRPSRALVLGAGGITGAAWELGVVVGLRDKGVEVTDADLVEGTSAGSIIGAEITSGGDLEELYDLQLRSVAGTLEAMPPPDLSDSLRAIAAGFDAPDKRTARARIGAAAMSAHTMSEPERLEMVAARLHAHEWPERALVMNAVDAETGEWVTFDSQSGVPLPLAVAASCAVPGIYPPTTIRGHRYIDGGMSSATNADFARRFDRVLILLAMPAALSAAGGPMDPILRVAFEDELATLEQAGAHVLVVERDEASAAAFGDNPLDASRRAPSAGAGRAQGHAWAERVKLLWTE